MPTNSYAGPRLSDLPSKLPNYLSMCLKFDAECGKLQARCLLLITCVSPFSSQISNTKF